MMPLVVFSVAAVSISWFLMKQVQIALELVSLRELLAELFVGKTMLRFLSARHASIRGRRAACIKVALVCVHNLISGRGAIPQHHIDSEGNIELSLVPNVLSAINLEISERPSRRLGVGVAAAAAPVTSVSSVGRASMNCIVSPARRRRVRAAHLDTRRS